MPAQTRRVDLTGQKKLMKVLTTLASLAPQIVGAALYREGGAIMTKSKKLCPVDLGNLRATGDVAPPEEHGGHVTVTLGYGGPAAKYAVAQHERLDFKHTVGQAKYLEDPMLEAAQGMDARIGVSIKKGIEDAAR